MATLVFYGQFTAAKAGKTGLTPLVDIRRVTRADGTRAPLVTAGAAIEDIRGVYLYVLTGCDLQIYDYIAYFVTSDTSVDLKEVPGVWVRWSEAVATDAAGKVFPADGSIATESFAAEATLPVVEAIGTLAYDSVVEAVQGAMIDPWSVDLSEYTALSAGSYVYASLEQLTSGAGGGGVDPWTIPLPGSYPAGSAGELLATNLDARVSTRSTYAGGPVASVMDPATIEAALSAAHGSGAWDGTTADWTDAERGQIRHRLGIGGPATTPTATPSLSVYAGGPVAAVAAPVNLNLGQPLEKTKATTVGGALAGSWLATFGRALKDRAGKLLELFWPGDTTPLVTFDLDDATNPSSRTPRP